jgi:uncharacterized repeat protein (TIGR02543 family)
MTGCGDKTYTVTFDTMGGSLINSITLKKGSVLGDVKIPSKDGYLFVNWLKDGILYDNNSPITEDITLTASWTEKPVVKKEYAVSFVTEKYVEKILVEEGNKVSEPEEPSKKDYIFLGWFVGDEKYDFNEVVTKDIILTAKYELDVVTITFDLDGGIGIAMQNIPTNTSLSIPEVPVKKGHRFLKWTLDGNEFNFNEKISEDITIKAVWEKIEYVTVCFDTDGGNLIDNKVVERYSKIDELPVPIKNGYVFKEWQLNGNIFDSESTVLDSVTLKAIYEIIEENQEDENME